LEKFKSFITEAKKPYKLVVLSHDDPHDPNETGVLIRKKSSNVGIDCLLVEMGGFFISEEEGKLFVNSFPVDDKGQVEEPSPKKESKYIKPYEIRKDDTIIMVRGQGTPGVTGNHSWMDIAKDLEYRGFTVINSSRCHDICSDKFMSQIYFERHKIRTPKTVRIAHIEDSDNALKKLKSNFPIILKTTIGSKGIGVILVESAPSLNSIVQLLYRENEYIDILLQEQIETSYDVRVIICNGEAIASIKRPVVKGDFRSNVSQGSEPVSFDLTDLERSESIRAAKVVEGMFVGVDFIAAKDREKESPYFIEVNSTPGLIGIEEVGFSVTERVLEKLKSLKLSNKS